MKRILDIFKKKRAFEAVQAERFSNVSHSSPSPRIQELIPLKTRVRHLAQNNPHAKRALSVISGYLVGSGITPHAFKVDGKRDSKLDNLLKEWADTCACDIEGQTNLYGIQNVEEGEQPETIKDDIIKKLSENSFLNEQIEFIPFQLEILPDKFKIDPANLKEKAEKAIKAYLLDKYVPKGWRSITSFTKYNAEVSDGIIYTSRLADVLNRLDGQISHSIDRTDELQIFNGKITPQSEEVFYVKAQF